MAALRDMFLVCIAILHLFHLAVSCPPSRPPCSWTTCRTEWRNDWTPSYAPQGRCTEQRRRNHILTYRHHGKGSCPGSQRCYYSYQNQRLCSCLDVYSCPLHQWSGWSGNPPQGQCSRQSRYRNYNPQSRYTVRQHHCNGFRTNCGPTQYDYRTYCSCRYAECNLDSWSSWADLPNPVHKDHCASQKRTRGYKVQWKFFYRRDNCNGVGPLKCPNIQEETREKVVTCPLLKAPAHGSWDRDDCAANPQTCKSTCKLQCDVKNGFIVSGPGNRVCRANGQWSTPWNSYCKDNQNPTITCPPRKEVGNDPGKDTARVQLPKPSVKDNSGKPVRIDNDAGADSKDFKIQDIEHVIKYTAIDADGNKASCNYYLTVKDKERPSVVKCPDDIKIRTNKPQERVAWDYPTFKDNYDKEPQNPLRITSNANPGTSMTWGVHKVVYTAYDRAQNNASCEFFVDVGPHKCPLFDPPNNGVRACNKLVNNVTYEMMCNVQCKKGFAFSKPAAGIYMCQSSGLWQKMVNGFPVPVTNMENKPWPDCAPEEVANAAKKEFTFYTGSCVGDEQEALKQIRQNFLKAIKESPLAHFALCQVSQNQDCVVDNVKVYCGTKSKRNSNIVIKTRVITFDLVVKDLKPSPDVIAETAKLKNILKGLIMLEGYLKNQFPTDAEMPGLQVEARKGDIICDPPKVKRVLKADESEIACVECAMGSYYDNKTKSCLDCPVGQYQDTDGQTYCKPCPQGKASVEYGASSVLQCYDTCKAGEYMHKSHGGAITCLACPLGSYQPKPLSNSCIQCPDGKSTSSVGSLSPNDCM